MPPATSGLTLARTRESKAGAAPVREHETGQHVDFQQRDLIAPGDDQRGRDAGERAVTPRTTIKRAREEKQRDRQIGEADDLSDVLQPRAGRTAECERQRRDQRAGRMPAAVAEIQNDAEPAEEQIRECDRIVGLETRRAALTKASSTCSGEASIDCGSATFGQPANTSGAQNGD